MGFEEWIECRKQSETRTATLLNQLQKKTEDLEKEREYEEIHFNPAVIPREVSVSARYRILSEGVNVQEWILVDVKSENENWSKWVFSSALKSVLPETDLPEELTHTLEVCRMENSSHREGVNEELERVREEYETYKKRTKTATILLQDRCLEAMNEVKTLRESLNAMEKRASMAEEASRTSEENEKKRASETESELEEMRMQLKEKEDSLREIQQELLSQGEALKEEEKRRLEVEMELQEKEKSEKTLREEIELKDAALERFEKAVKMLEHTATPRYSGDEQISETNQPVLDSGNESSVRQQSGVRHDSNPEINSSVPIQVVSEAPISLQMPVEVRMSTESNQDSRLDRRSEEEK